MAVANYKNEIARSSEILKKFRKSKELFNREKEILELMQQRYGLNYSQIHEYLAPKKTEKSEKEIQELIKDLFTLDLPICEIKIKSFRNYIEIYQKHKEELVGYSLRYKWVVKVETQPETYSIFISADKPKYDMSTKQWIFGDKSRKVITAFSGLMVNEPITLEQIIKITEDNINLCYKYLQDWLQLYEDNTALVAFRHLETFCNFLEWDKRDKDKVWKYSFDPYNDGGYTGVNKPFFYYFNQMVLKKDIKFISKQQSTGSGKSYSNVFAISWLLGIDSDNDVLLVLGNPALVMTNVRSIVELIKNPRYVKVFPQFAKYLERREDKNGNIIEVVSDNIFSVCRNKEGELTLADSNKPLNLKVISKDTSIDGIRVRYLFLDDICRSKDAGNMKQHETDINNFWNSWWKRNYNTDDFYIVIGATAYSIFDIVSQLISYFSKGKMKKSQEFKYAYRSMDDTCAFIKVPKIDDELNRSTYPQKFSYEEAIKIKERDYRTFMAMEQQQPMPPDNSPFYIENLQGYDVIPEEGRSEFCWASLDSARVGNDFNAMPIFVKVGEKFYLKDCLYLNEPMEKVYNKIVDKIIQHRISKFVIEKNIDTSLKALLDKMLKEQGISYCEIIEVYATTKKEEKIYNMENTIKNCLVFPNQHLYAFSSQMGKFMADIYGFSYTHKNDHDDSIDAIATFCQRLIIGSVQRPKVIVVHM